MKSLWLRILLLILLGVPLKLAFEKPVQTLRKDLKLEGTALSIQLRSKLSQNLAIALLGGFRAITADWIYIFQVHTSWEDQVWYKLKEGAELCVVLQPHAISFWDLGSWHMAWNASYSESENPKYPNMAYRTRVKNDWIQAGRDFLEEGIKNNPNEYLLYFRQGWLIRERYEQPLDAIPYLKKAITFPEAPFYIKTMIGHIYEKAGMEREAYEWWKKVWREDQGRNTYGLMDRVKIWGKLAEEKLNVPNEERVFSFQKESNSLERVSKQNEVRDPR